MPIGSPTQRDNRRRRVILDDSNGSSSKKKGQNSSSEGNSGPPEPNYHDEALIENHPPSTSIIPSRWWVLTLIGLFVCAGIGLLNYLHLSALSWSEWYGADYVMGFSMTSNTGMYTWTCSILCLIAAYFCLQVGLIRRHRCDDYRGTFRLWTWLALFFTFASFNAATQAHLLVIRVLEVYLANSLQFENHRMICFAILTVPLSIIFIRMLMELNESRLATGFTLLGAVGFGAAILMRLNILNLPLTIDETLAHSNLTLVGYASLFMAVVVYSRYVLHDSQGWLMDVQARRAERRRVKDEKTAARMKAREEKAELARLEKEEKAAAAEQARKERDKAKAREKEDRNREKQERLAAKTAAKEEKENTRKQAAEEAKAKKEADRQAAAEAKAQKAAEKQAALDAKREAEAKRKADEKIQAEAEAKEKAAKRQREKEDAAKKREEESQYDPEHESRTIKSFEEAKQAKEQQAKRKQNSRRSTDLTIEEIEEKLTKNLNKSERRRLKKLLRRKQQEESEVRRAA